MKPVPPGAGSTGDNRGKMPVEMYEDKASGIGFIAGRWPLEADLPTVVFIHGSGGTNVLWRAQVEGLAGRMNTVAIDLPGRGGSDGEGSSSIAEYADAVAGFIDSIAAPRPVPCGLSIGGGIVLRLLLDDRDRYEAGILVNSGARLRVLPLILEAIGNDYEAFVNATYTGGISEKTDPSRVRPLVDSMARCPPEVTLGDFKACDSFDVMEHLEEIAVPVLVLTASDDRMTPVKYGRYLAEHIRSATLVNIEDAGHLSPMEKPEEVTRAILDFVESI
jgi:pimeloyl-ACP methyl ester carboxylesterase